MKPGDLKRQLEEVQISLALKGRLGERLPPHLWERARQTLQARYRMATGETDAVLTVESPRP